MRPEPRSQHNKTCRTGPATGTGPGTAAGRPGTGAGRGTTTTRAGTTASGTSGRPPRPSGSGPGSPPAGSCPRATPSSTATPTTPPPATRPWSCSRLNYAEPLPDPTPTRRWPPTRRSRTVVKSRTGTVPTTPPPPPPTDDPIVDRREQDVRRRPRGVQAGRLRRRRSWPRPPSRCCPATARCTSSGRWRCSPRGNYKEAAAGLYAVLAAGPGWDWDTMSGPVPDPETYTRQLRALEQYVGKEPAAGRGTSCSPTTTWCWATSRRRPSNSARWSALKPNDKLRRRARRRRRRPPATGARPPRAGG